MTLEKTEAYKKMTEKEKEDEKLLKTFAIVNYSILTIVLVSEMITVA